MSADIPVFLLKMSEPPKNDGNGRARSVTRVDQGIAGFAGIIRTAFVQWELNSGAGFLQSLDSRVKTLFWITLLVIISFKSTIPALLMISAAILLLGLLSRVSLSELYGRVIPLTLFFGFLISAPAALNIITPGEIVISLFEFAGPSSLWIYSIPQHIGVTDEGIAVCSRLTLRVFASLSLSFLMLATTPFSEIIGSLKLFRVPDTLLLILTLTYKYIYLFSQTIVDMYSAKKTRLVLGVSSAEFREWSAGRMATLFRKTEMKVEDIYRAMLCRGFSGEIRLSGARKFSVSDMKGGAVLVFFVFAALIV